MTETTKSNRWMLWTALSAAILVLFAVPVLLSRRDQPSDVELVRVVRTTLDASITSNGKIEPIDPHVVRAQFATFVASLPAVEGQEIHRGQAILTLDATDVTGPLAEARAALLAAQNDLRDARRGGSPDELAELLGNISDAQADVDRLERTQESLTRLVAKQAATRDELDQNGAALARARTQLETLDKKREALENRATLQEQSSSLRVQQAEEQIRSLESKISSAVVTSPADGTLYSLPVHVGDYVQLGEVLAETADLHKVRVRGFVDELDLGWLQPDQPVQITWDAMPNKMWSGRTEQVPKEVMARGTRSVGEVLCSVDNDHLELLPNVNVDLRIQVREQQRALVVPRGAVRSEDNRHYVFVMSGDRLYRRDVSVGIESATNYEVLSGLSEGDRVALPGDLDLRDGMLVHASNTK